MRSVLEIVLLPPFWAAVGVLAAFWLLTRRRLRASSICLGLTAALFVPLSTVAGARAVLLPLEREAFAPLPRAGEIDAVVVLAGGFAPSAHGVVELDGTSLIRLVRGLDARSAIDVSVPLFYVGALRSQVGALTDVAAARRDGASFDVETISTDTGEAPDAVARLLQQRGIPSRRIVLVTSAWHMRRALAVFRHAGFQVTPSACDERVPARLRWTAFLPSAGAWQESTTGIREWLALIKYRFSGRL